LNRSFGHWFQIPVQKNKNENIFKINKEDDGETELKIMKLVNHQYIVKVYRERLVWKMEEVAGSDLRNRNGEDDESFRTMKVAIAIL
jgi:hypothetical protein